MELRAADDRDPPGRGRERQPRYRRGRDLLRPVSHQAAAAPGARARSCGTAGAADRRARPHRRALRGVSARSALGLPDHHPRDRHDQGERAARRRHHLEPHPRDPRRVETPLLLSLDRLSECIARTRDPARQGAGRGRGLEPRGRRLRAEAARRQRPLQAAGCRRDDRLGACALAARRAGADARGHQRHAGRAAQIPGRHRQDPGLGSAAPAHPGEAGAGRGAVSGRLVENVMHFARALRAAGLPIGPGKVLAAIEALGAVGIADRQDFYWTLHAVFVNRRDQRELFDQAFHIFWRNPQLLEKNPGNMLPTIRSDEPMEEMSRRLAEALHPGDGKTREEPEPEKIELDAVMTFSDREKLQRMDFEKMSGEELRQARAALRRLTLPLAEAPIRRFTLDPRGERADMRASLRAQLRSTGVIALKRKRRQKRPPPLVVLCDISGSMSRYSRLFIQFMHAVTNDRDRVSTFLFGTRLTSITRYLRQKDVDVALDRVAAAVEDWSGGTRIGQSLAEFNRRWSRRVLGQGAVVLLITDGLDREGGQGIAQEMDRLHRSSRRLIWLNPLLRYEGFAPKSQGMRAILPHVDEFRPVHNLQSLEELVEALSRPGRRRLDAAAAWREAG